MKSIFSANLILIVFVLFSACRLNLMTPLPEGGIRVFSAQEGSKAISQELADQIDHYIVSGNGPNDNTFSLLTNTLPVEKVDCIKGNWTITVQAYDAADQLIAVGTDTAVVEEDGLTDLVITLDPATAGGMIDFSVQWDPNLVVSAETEVFLTSNDGGDVISLVTTEYPGDVNFHQENISAGFYTLQVFLKDQGIYVMGAVEMVEIKDGLLSSLNFDFHDINKVGQAVTITDNSFTIAWEDYNTPGTVDEYRIYYREHDTQGWSFLDNIPGGDPVQYTVTTSALAKGNWDFAVSIVSGGIESELHTSMDDIAVPATGWYVEWI